MTELSNTVRNIYQREWRSKHAERLRPVHREYIREWRKKNGYAAEEKWKAVNPNKVRAHRILRRAVRSGKMTKKPCEVCKDVASVAHHDDYAKPLKVRWLCKIHHRQIHYRELKWEETAAV